MIDWLLRQYHNLFLRCKSIDDVSGMRCELTHKEHRDNPHWGHVAYGQGVQWTD